jgi:hypothetical protein
MAEVTLHITPVITHVKSRGMALVREQGNAIVFIVALN